MTCIVKTQKSRLKIQNLISYKPNGFTLLELMVTLSLIAILAAIATPSFISSIKRNAILSERRDANPSSCFRFLSLSLLLVPWGE